MKIRYSKDLQKRDIIEVLLLQIIFSELQEIIVIHRLKQLCSMV